MQKFLCFVIFVKTLKIQNGRHFWRGKTFWKLGQLLSGGTLWVKNFVRIALSSTVFEIQGCLCFTFLKKIPKFKMATILTSKIFVETWKG